MGLSLAASVTPLTVLILIPQESNLLVKVSLSIIWLTRPLLEVP